MERARVRRARLNGAAVLAMAMAIGCGGGGGGGSADAHPPAIDAAPPGGATAVFTPPTPGAGAAWGTMPFPSDLFLDDTGHLKLLSFPSGPGADPQDATALAVAAALSQLDGAGAWTNVYIPVDADVDPTTLAGNVAFVELGDNLVELPVDVLYRPDLNAIVLALPFGVVLREGASYAAYATSDIHATDGTALGAPDAFLQARDLATTPSDPAIAAAQTSLRPLLEALPAGTVEQLATATVFRIADVTSVTKEMRDIAVATPPTVSDISVRTDMDRIFGPDPDGQPGWDIDTVIRDQPHGSVRALVHGTMQLPSFTATTRGATGLPTFDASGTPIVKGTIGVRFTIMIPDIGSLADLPMVVFLHGVGKTRVDLVTLAETYASRGIGMIAIDVVYHGDRVASPRDTEYTVTGEDVASPEVADGFGDTGTILPPGTFFQLTSGAEFAPLDPQVVSENVRRMAIDVCSVAAFVRAGDVAPINAALQTAGLDSDLSFGTNIAVHAESFGAMMAGIAVAVEPNLDAAVLAYPPAGFPFPTMFRSAYYYDTFQPALAPGMLQVFGASDRVVPGDPARDGRFDPLTVLWTWAMQRGDPAAYAPYVINGELRGDSGPHMLVLQAFADEWVPNESTEHYAKALGLETVPLSVAPDTAVRFVSLPETPAPASANLSSGNTGALVTFNEAGHAFVTWHSDILFYEPDRPPFVLFDEGVRIADPIDEAQAMIGRFVDDFQRGAAPTVVDPFVASGAAAK